MLILSLPAGVRGAFYAQVALSVIVALLPRSDYTASAWGLNVTFWALLIAASLQWAKDSLTLLQAVVTSRLLLLHALGSAISLAPRFRDDQTASAAVSQSVALLPPPSTTNAGSPPLAPAQSGQSGQSAQILPIGSRPSAKTNPAPSYFVKVSVLLSNVAIFTFSIILYCKTPTIGPDLSCNPITRVSFFFASLSATRAGRYTSLALTFISFLVYLLIHGGLFLTWLRKNALTARNIIFDSHIRNAQTSFLSISYDTTRRSFTFQWGRRAVFGMTGWVWIILLGDIERTLYLNRVDGNDFGGFGQVSKIKFQAVGYLGFRHEECYKTDA